MIDVSLKRIDPITKFTIDFNTSITRDQEAKINTGLHMPGVQLIGVRFSPLRMIVATSHTIDERNMAARQIISLVSKILNAE